jgi:hypothetical protein
MYVKARKSVLDHPYTWEVSTVQQFSITLLLMDLRVMKIKHQVLSEYKIFIHEMVT